MAGFRWCALRVIHCAAFSGIPPWVRFSCLKKQRFCLVFVAELEALSSIHLHPFLSDDVLRYAWEGAVYLAYIIITRFYYLVQGFKWMQAW